jgi:hypothetical protein
VRYSQACRQPALGATGCAWLVTVFMLRFSLFLALDAILMAQTGPGEIVRRSAANEARGLEARDNYSYTKLHETKRLDSHGQVQSDEVKVSKITFVNGSSVEQTVSHNGGPPLASQERKDLEALERAGNETSSARAARLARERETRAFIAEVPEAFVFRPTGEEQINGRAAYIFEATAKPGYQSRTKYGKLFSKAQGKLWVDKQDLGWVRVDATVTDSFYTGFFLAKVQPGSQIVFEQTRAGDGLWLPKKVEVKASARVFLLFNYNTEEIITFSDYSPR